MGNVNDAGIFALQAFGAAKSNQRNYRHIQEALLASGVGGLIYMATLGKIEFDGWNQFSL